MPLSWNEIKDRALAFSREWIDESRETAESQTFWNQFFEVFGLTRRRVASFEEPVKKLGDRRGEIDLFWKGMLIAEHKSRGRNLDRAYRQALDYFPGIAERDLPRYVLVSDFQRLRLHDLDTGEDHEFPLAKLHEHVGRFAFVAGYSTQKLAPEDPVNRKAAERMGRLHDRLKASGFEGHALEVLLVRLLFCLFAEDTGIFQPRKSFQDWIENRTVPDGSNLGALLAQFFQVLNTPEDKRSTALDEQLAAFPYVNGKLFEEHLPIADFDSGMREALLDACALDWSQISPAIFGALFQSIMDAKARRNLGAHYTSERNILKLIQPLFLDELRAEFERTKSNKNRLFEFHKKLRTLTFLDPACGCGNFLVVAYRELRLLELDVLRAARTTGQRVLDAHSLVQLDVDQFHGIEIEEFPAQIAQVALWLTDHQMNLKVSEEFGLYFARIPLKSSPNIVHANALRIDWNAVLPAERCSYVMGNPPFVGHQWRSLEQVADMDRIWCDAGRFGRLDYVSCWHRLGVEYARPNPAIRLALVSTNSICQGEQVGILWPWMLENGVRIHFAHRTFQWTNEARGVAGVHCIIVGFGLCDSDSHTIYDYGQNLRGEPTTLRTTRINPYLVDAADVILPSRTRPPAGMPQLIKGSQPTDGGFLIFTDEEHTAFLETWPASAKWMRPYLGGEELINGGGRWCLWLKNADPVELRSVPGVVEQLAKVRNARLKSPTASVREFADRPALFTQDRQPEMSYIAVPEVSSENRRFIPIGFLPASVIASNKLQIIKGGDRWLFGMLCSTMHNAWMRVVGGRLKSDYSYAPSVYNNFPWPIDATDAHRAAIESAAQSVLDTRATFPDASLADLYDPLTMPPTLVKAHQVLDRAVDAAYVPSGGRKTWASDAERVAFLFTLYQRLTGLLPPDAPARTATRRRRATRGRGS